MTYYPNRFFARVVKVQGFEAQDIYHDQWGAKQIGSIATNNPGLRVGWDRLYSPDRQPRSTMERWLGQLGGRSTQVELDPDSLEITTAHYYNAYPTYKGRGGRIIMGFEGTGSIPEFNDRAVHLIVSNTVMHAPNAQEHEIGTFMNQVFVAPLPKAR